MKTCPRCGFLNPDRGETCMKCRCGMGESGGSIRQSDGRRGPVRDPFDVGFSETGANPTTPGPAAGPVGEPDVRTGPVNELPPPGKDAPAGGPRRQDAGSPVLEGGRASSSIDDMFASGSGFDPGGYRVDGPVTEPLESLDAPGDAYAVMTGNNVLSGSYENTGRKRGGARGKPARRRKKDPLQRAIDEIPTASLNNPFGLLSQADEVSQDLNEPPSRNAGSKHRDTTPRAALRAPASRDARPRGPAGTSGAEGLMPGREGPGAGGAFERRAREGLDGSGQNAAGGFTGWTEPGVSAGPVAGGRTSPASPPAPSSLQTAVEKVKEIATPRALLGTIASALAVAAAAYLIAGGGYFAGDGRKALDAAAGAMAAQKSVHIQAEAVANSEKMGTQSSAASIDVSNDTDQRVVYAAGALMPQTEFVAAAGKTFRRTESGPWETSGNPNPDFTAGSLFDSASCARVLGREPVDNVTCDRIAFESGPEFACSLFPGARPTTGTRVTTEMWMEPLRKTVRHLRIDARDLVSSKLGRFDCKVEASVACGAGHAPIGAPI